MIACNNVQHLIVIKLKKSETKFGAKRAKIRPNISFFCHFLKLGSLLFLEVDSLQQCLAYNDSLQQYLTFGRRKIYEINFSQKGQNLAQI